MGRKPFVANRKTAKVSNSEVTDEEFDYMSETVIEKVKEEVLAKEKYLPKKKKEKTFKQPLSHSAMREKALETPISTSNVGFKLLQQMGYKEGEGLGKQKEGIINPLDVLMKRNRLGLGVDDEMGPIRKSAKLQSASSAPTLGHETIKAYQSYQRDRFRESKVNGQLKASVSICMSLDSVKEITENPLLPTQFLPRSDITQEEADKTALELVPLSLEEKEESLNDITMYLRAEHLYCFFCASKFENQTEMDDYCPGPSEDAHQL